MVQRGNFRSVFHNWGIQFAMDQHHPLPWCGWASLHHHYNKYTLGPECMASFIALALTCPGQWQCMKMIHSMRHAGLFLTFRRGRKCTSFQTFSTFTLCHAAVTYNAIGKRKLCDGKTLRWRHWYNEGTLVWLGVPVMWGICDERLCNGVTLRWGNSMIKELWCDEGTH